MNSSHFLTFARTRAAILQARGIDALSWQMLEDVALAESIDQPLRVTELMNQRKHGSPATIHRRLASLRKAKLVSVRSGEHDSRVKWLAITEDGKALFNDLDQSLLKTATQAEPQTEPQTV